MKKGKLFVISAPSGAGKTSLVKEVLKRLNNFNIAPVISYTSRPSRNGEHNGGDYHFISHDEFLKKMQNNFFLETTLYNNHAYGSPASTVQDVETGKSRILVIDIQGAQAVHNAYPDAVCIWINAPSEDILRKRLIKRGTESMQQIEKRLEQARFEIKEAEIHKTRLFRYHLVNDVFEHSVAELAQIIKDELEG